MEALKLEPYVAINRFVQDEKRRYKDKVISLKQVTEQQYVDSLTNFEKM